MIIDSEKVAIQSKIQKTSWQIDQVLPLDYQLPASIWENLDQHLHYHFLLLLSRDVYSEGDSQALFNYLLARKDEFTPEFLQMINEWFRDEQKHYEALRRVYRLISGVSFSDMDQSFDHRCHEIEPIAPILKDEFTILVAFLFDEMGSTISYRRDLREFYCHYGPVVHRIGKNLVIDEGLHFQNAVRIIRAKHSDRLREIPSLLASIAQLENRLGRYCKTFFLDHAQEQGRFPPQFNEVIIEIILAQFNWGNYPKNASLLWSWKPEVLPFVPMLGL